MKSKRNKTIDFNIQEGQRYLKNCITADDTLSAEKIIDKTIVGDTFDVLKKLPRGIFDLMIADPPYNMDKRFDGEKFKKLSYDDYLNYTVSWLSAALPLLKRNASVYVCCDWRSSGAISQALDKLLIVRNRITWQREKGRGCKKNWKNAMEDIWFCTVSDDYVFNLSDVKMRRRVIAPYRDKGEPKDWEQTPCGNFRDTCPSNFWDDISVPYWSMAENTSHPTQKPEKLLAKLILASSDAGDLVLDPFLGSGSTSVTAKKLGRHYTGIEKSPLYCAWAEKRLEDAKWDKTIQGYNDGVFWERNTAPRANKIKKSENK